MESLSSVFSAISQYVLVLGRIAVGFLLTLFTKYGASSLWSIKPNFEERKAKLTRLAQGPVFHRI
jgi:hypothetical protein